MTTIASTGRTTTAQRQARRSKTEGQQPQKSTDGLRMHILHARLPLPYLTPGDVSANVRTVASRIPSRPAPETIALYGGLGALAVAGALDWPVALVIGGATAVLRSRGEEQGTPEHQEAETGNAPPAKAHRQEDTETEAKAVPKTTAGASAKNKSS
ncbi:hypothetical protein GCM10010358_71190 [Streptomyces minutiscleroticus]|uniref:Uncharacterized protein n=1 Tax=Streptomyces minutiscleroticus TaxID=68238 RepID=A0A918U7L9_9ACTN|nr:hypothetical protein [Streptomyces minutiscleroticus]GGY07847.1 hypothetical protein GCM10010358_71190 [Streptomyces minutiscleroticus]